MVEYPKPNLDELPELYTDLDHLLVDVEQTLREHFEVRTKNGVDMIFFGEADQDTYLEAIHADRDTMIPFFQKIAGVPDRELERLYGVANFNRFRTRKSDFYTEEEAIIFANAMVDLLPDNLYLETPLYTFVKMWENDQRRHVRARYERDVREYLDSCGFSNFKGNSLPGEPDFVVPNTEPYEVIGEVRVIQPRDYKKRFKEFGSEARAAEIHFPNAKFVAVAHVGRQIERRNRAELRKMLYESSAAEIHAAFFQDELNLLVNKLEEWGISRSKR
ncbi:hypothetical protein [Natronorarus salvus]|uniref:hypothetical protein n=1 Tax=Natronorarus salvus TaxID=3117733 RepID=UPI002F26A042